MAEHVGVPAVTIPEHHLSTTGQSHRKVLMWTFLGSDCMFFGALVGTFLVYNNNTGGGPIQQDVLSSLGLVSLMAFVLLASSFTMVLALAAARRGDQTGMTLWILATAFFGLFFIGAQGFEFYSFVNHHFPVYDAQGNVIGHSGLNPATNLFGASFMALTGFHGAHVTGGVIWLFSVALMVRVSPDRPRLNVKAILLMSGFVGTVLFGGMIAILWREIGWLSLAAATPASLVAGGIVAMGFLLKYLRELPPEPTIHRQPITATLLPRFLAFLSGNLLRRRESLEVQDRYRRHTAFSRGVQQPDSPASSEELDAAAMHQYEGLQLNEERVLNVELVGLYWHFVDVVWVVIFTVIYLLQGEHPFK